MTAPTPASRAALRNTATAACAIREEMARQGITPYSTEGSLDPERVLALLDALDAAEQARQRWDALLEDRERMGRLIVQAGPWSDDNWDRIGQQNQELARLVADNLGPLLRAALAEGA